jgi:uncharacterized protein (TIGR02996 family)
VALLLVRMPTGEEYEQELDRNQMIGRDARCVVRIDDEGAAPHHAWLRARDGEVVIEPVHGAVVWIGDQAVTTPYALAAREPFRIGRHTLELLTLAAATTAVTTAALPVRFATEDGMEQRLLAAIRSEPSDELARSVYADWLEQHGGGIRAAFLRGEAEGESIDRLRELAVVHDVAWRAIASRAPVDRCDEACGKRWCDLVSTSDDTARTCADCDRTVHYCGSLADGVARGSGGAPIAIDAALDRNHVLRAYDAALGGPPMVRKMVLKPPR